MRKQELRRKARLIQSRINFIERLLILDRLQVSDNDWTDGFRRGISFASNVLNGQPDFEKVPPGVTREALILRYDPAEHDDRT